MNIPSTTNANSAFVFPDAQGWANAAAAGCRAEVGYFAVAAGAVAAAGAFKAGVTAGAPDASSPTGLKRNIALAGLVSGRT